MKFSKLVPIAGFCIFLSSVGNAQFSVSGGGAAIPASGTGGDAAVAGDGGAIYDTVQPGLEGVSSATVGVAVTSIESIEIDGLVHSWIGDTQGTLEDPNGVEHLIWLRPGYLNTSGFGSAGDFDGGTYTFVGDGSGMSLPTSSANTNIPAGTYNQTFTSGGTTWVSGTNGINNTPMNSIAGPAGTWSLHIYDWGGGDSGSFAGWTLNGNGGGGPNTGAAYCFGDGTGAVCPFGNFGAPGEGCLNSSGTGAVATATGSAEISNDSWVITVTGAAFNKPGLFFQGPTALALPAGAGILCSNSTLRYSVNPTDATGSTSQAGFGVNASIGQTLNYQYWFRDPGFPLPGAGSPQFNFTNAWRVTWI